MTEKCDKKCSHNSNRKATFEDKLRAIEYAESFGNRGAARKFGVYESTIRYWKQQKHKITETIPWKKSFSGPKHGKYYSLDKNIFKYFVPFWRNGLAVNDKLIKDIAMEIAAKQGVTFNASNGWLWRFKKRIKRKSDVSICDAMKRSSTAMRTLNKNVYNNSIVVNDKGMHKRKTNNTTPILLFQPGIWP